MVDFWHFFVQSVFCILSFVFSQSVFEIKYTNTKPVAMHIGRAGKCVDDDDDDSGGRKQRGC